MSGVDQGAHNSGMITSMNQFSAAGQSGGGGTNMGANGPTTNLIEDQGLSTPLGQGAFAGSILGAKGIDDTMREAVGNLDKRIGGISGGVNLLNDVQMRQISAQVGSLMPPTGIGFAASLSQGQGR